MAVREVPIPAFLVGKLAEHVAGKGEDELVFPGVRGGGALRATVFRRAAFDEAAAAIGLPGLASARAAAHRGVPGDRGRR